MLFVIFVQIKSLCHNNNDEIRKSSRLPEKFKSVKVTKRTKYGGFGDSLDIWCNFALRN